MRIPLELPDNTFMLTATCVYVMPDSVPLDMKLGCSVQAVNGDQLIDGNVIVIGPKESEGAK